MDRMRPVLAAVVAVVVVGLGVFTVVSLLGEPAEAPPVQQLTPAGSFSLADPPAAAVPVPVQSVPEAVGRPAPAATAPSSAGSGSAAAGQQNGPADRNDATGNDDGDSKPHRDSDGDGHHNGDQDKPDEHKGETPAERNERIRREIAYRFCDKYHVPRERCQVK